MRIYICADIEGVSGVTHPEQTRPGSSEYERARLLMTREVNAAIQGALDGGAAEIHVADSHGTYRNLLFDQLHPEARLLSGKPRPGGMMAGFTEDHGPWDGIFLLGAHARAGASGVLAHTINSQAFALITVNGKAVGETFLNAALAAERNTPVLLVSGDDCLAREASSFLPDAQIITVKQSLSNRSAVHLPLQTVHDALHDAAEMAVGRAASGHDAPLSLLSLPESPLWTEVTTLQPVQADAFALVPGVRQLYATAVGFETETIADLIRMLNVFSLMAASL